jgi:hypothetical protein
MKLPRAENEFASRMSLIQLPWQYVIVDCYRV